VERDVQKFGGRFSMFEAIGDDAKGKGLDPCHGFVAVRSVAHNASQIRYFRQPPAVTLTLKLDRKGQASTVTSEPAG
jgi:hypothetical protein